MMDAIPSDPHAATSSAVASDEPVTKFLTPENAHWLSKHGYSPLNRRLREIRLLQISMKRVTAATLEKDYPQWMRSGTDAYDEVTKYRDQKEIRCDDMPGTITDTVEESAQEELIACELLTSPINVVEKQYAAMSYCAGSLHKTERILVDGFWFNCFQNLEHAIRQVKLSGSAFSEHPFMLLWTDQICINQTDHVEKSHQVAFMRDIYQTAKTTFVCLSVPDAPSGVTDRLQICAKVHEHFAEKQTSVQSIEQRLRGLAETLEKQDWIKLQQLVIEMILQPWWTRSWVFQEFLVSPHVSFLFWDIWFSWPEIEPLLYTLRVSKAYGTYPSPEKFLFLCADGPHSSSKSYYVPPPAHRLEIIVGWHAIKNERLALVDHILYSKRWWSGGLEFLHLIGSCHVFSATDPRDLIYSFAGIVDSAPSSRIMNRIQPDYSPSYSVAALLRDIAEGFITDFKCPVTALSNAVQHSRGEYGLAYPTWVADWTMPPTRWFNSWLSATGHDARNDVGLRDVDTHDFNRGPPLYRSISRELATPWLAKLDSTGLRLQVLARKLCTLDAMRRNYGDFSCVFRVCEHSALATRTWGEAEAGDEVWHIHKAAYFNVLRLVSNGNEGYMLIGYACIFDLRLPETGPGPIFLKPHEMTLIELV